MIKQPFSIFNDVIGPVMRGPSSSHAAAAARIGKLVGQMVKGSLREVLVEFEPKGSLSTTYHGHGSDMGFVGGLLGYGPWDEGLTRSLAEAENKGIVVRFEITDYEASHPNTYRISVWSDRNEHVRLTAVSTGGGMIEIRNLNDMPASIAGDFFETVLLFDGIDEDMVKIRKHWVETEIGNIEYCDSSVKGSQGMIVIKTCCKLPETTLERIYGLPGIKDVMQLSPVLPVMSRKNCTVPFHTPQEMIETGKLENLELWQLASLYEGARGNITAEEVFERMKDIVLHMEDSIEQGLKGTEYSDRILGPQAWMMDKARKDGKILPGGIINTVISHITSIMEVKSSMGVIVAAPTAGSCGALPGTVIGAAREMNLGIEEMTKSMLAAGIIGVFIAANSGFAAEVGGCQVECGAGSGMAAAGLVQLMGGSVQQCVDAASMALQNILGMVCDPVGDRVEVPCLGKNIMAGVNAIACANMALAGFDKVVPLDETLKAMEDVGKMLPPELRCTGLGGLSVTETSNKIYKRLNGM